MTATLDWRNEAKTELEKIAGDLEAAHKSEEQQISDQAKVDTTLIPPSDGYYWTTVVLYIVAQVVLGLYAWLSLTTKVVPIGIPVNVGVAILLLQALHFIGSFRSIGVNDLAGFSFFGRPWYIPKSGLYLIPLWILTLIKADRNYKDKRFPGPPNKVFRVSSTLQETREGGDMPPEDKDMVRPIFVMTGESRLTDDDKKKLKENGEMNPLDRQLSVEISYFVRYRPDQEYGGIFRIARNLASQTGSIDERIQDLVQEQSERDMKAVLSRHTPATIIENWDLVNKVFILKLRLAVMRLGIDVDKNGGGLDDLNVSHKTNDAQAEVTREQFKKLATITKAEAEKIRRQKEREGDAAGELAWLTAQAEGRKKMKEQLGIENGETILAAEAVREISANTDVLVVGAEGGMRDVLGLVKGAQSALNATKKGA